MGSAASREATRASQAGLARLFGVTRQSINELVARGILEVGQDGRLDVELARLALAERLRQTAKTAQAAEAAAPGGGASAPPEASSQAPEDLAKATSFHVARTLREATEAKMTVTLSFATAAV